MFLSVNDLVFTEWSAENFTDKRLFLARPLLYSIFATFKGCILFYMKNRWAFCSTPKNKNTEKISGSFCSSSFRHSYLANTKTKRIFHRGYDIISVLLKWTYFAMIYFAVNIYVLLSMDILWCILQSLSYELNHLIYFSEKN